MKQKITKKVKSLKEQREDQRRHYFKFDLTELEKILEAKKQELQDLKVKNEELLQEKRDGV